MCSCVGVPNRFITMNPSVDVDALLLSLKHPRVVTKEENWDAVPSTDEWMSRMWTIHKENESLIDDLLDSHRAMREECAQLQRDIITEKRKVCVIVFVYFDAVFFCAAFGYRMDATVSTFEEIQENVRLIPLQF